jgi:hypothetical protein
MQPAATGEDLVSHYAMDTVGRMAEIKEFARQIEN